MITVDFETDAIQKRPKYPPKPVGVSIKRGGRKSRYYAWGHPTENNCTKEETARVLTDIWKSKEPKLFHHAKFDMEVANAAFGLPILPPEMFEDTMFLAFLYNPRARTTSLKPTSETLLNMPPEEQQDLRAWVLAHVPGAMRSKDRWGAHIALAPGKLVGMYARGDTDRTYALYRYLYPTIKQWGMSEAYMREKRLVELIIDMEARGIMLDLPRLEVDLINYEKEFLRIDNRIRRKLGDINVGSGAQVAKAMEARNMVTKWEYTPKGNIKTNRDSLARCCNDKRLVTDLGRYSRLKKVLTTYMRPWTESAAENGGVFYPWFNQIKGDNGFGTKTGRFSSNFQQVPREPEDHTLPFMRNYVIPDDTNQVLLNRDYSQQELRILAHYEDALLLKQYNETPTMDVHEAVGKMIEDRAGHSYPRSHIKQTNFGVIYGSGAASTANRLGISLEEAQTLLKNHKIALPGVKDLQKDIIKRSRRNKPLRTGGGRIYFPEKGFEYRMVNVLIQGSAADHTKDGMYRIWQATKKLPKTRVMLSVHDEFMVSTPKRGWKKAMQVFREAMDADTLFDLPMLSDGKVGDCWGSMEKCE